MEEVPKAEDQEQVEDLVIATTIPTPTTTLTEAYSVEDVAQAPEMDKVSVPKTVADASSEDVTTTK